MSELKPPIMAGKSPSKGVKQQRHQGGKKPESGGNRHSLMIGDASGVPALFEYDRGQSVRSYKFPDKRNRLHYQVGDVVFLRLARWKELQRNYAHVLPEDPDEYSIWNVLQGDDVPEYLTGSRIAAINVSQQSVVLEQYVYLENVDPKTQKKTYKPLLLVREPPTKLKDLAYIWTDVKRGESLNEWRKVMEFMVQVQMFAFEVGTGGIMSSAKQVGKQTAKQMTKWATTKALKSEKLLKHMLGTVIVGIAKIVQKLSGPLAKATTALLLTTSQELLQNLGLQKLKALIPDPNSMVIYGVTPATKHAIKEAIGKGATAFVSTWVGEALQEVVDKHAAKDLKILKRVYKVLGPSKTVERIQQLVLHDVRAALIEEFTVKNAQSFIDVIGKSAAEAQTAADFTAKLRQNFWSEAQSRALSALQTALPLAGNAAGAKTNPKKKVQ